MTITCFIQRGSFLVAALVLLSISSLTAAERPVKIDAATDSESKLREYVRYLSSDELRGRDAAGETIHQAATYIAEKMDATGILTTSIDGKPFQSVSVPLGAEAGDFERNYVRFEFASGDEEPADQVESDVIVAKLNQDMNPLTLGAVSGNARGKLIFAGYGITAPRLNYDDYEGIDARGAIVAVLRKEPGVSDPASPFDGVKNTRHAYFMTKVENAIRHGATAVLIVNDPNSIEEAMKIVRYKISQEVKRSNKIVEQIDSLPKEARNSRDSFRLKLESIKASIQALKQELDRTRKGLLGISEAGSVGNKDFKIPVVSISRQLLDQVMKQRGEDPLAEIESRINDRIKPDSREIVGLTCSLRAELKPTAAESPNVIGIIPGKGRLSNESVVLGAHYDHVGMGGYGSLAPGTVAIHNGADDNASGTAVMLVAGEILKRRLKAHASHRRVVLIAFTGEERGLIGSKHYVDHPVFPLPETSAMVNLDMVGRLRDNELTVYGTGSATGLEEIVESANETQGFDLFKIPTGYGPSDHQSFYKAGVPVLFFFTGLHNDYHRPSDDFDKIDFGGMTRITDIVSDVTLRLAVRSERPKYVETENRVQIRRQLTAYLGVNLSDRGDHVVISGVSSNSPAQISGLKERDQLSRLGKRRVRTSEDVLELLRGRSPGDSLKVQVLRDGKLLEVDVKLGKRPTG